MPQILMKCQNAKCKQVLTYLWSPKVMKIKTKESVDWHVPKHCAWQNEKSSLKKKKKKKERLGINVCKRGDR